ncbi:MAG TPA: hypothetical protein PLV45_07190 [bacterium]|nr:hypothetical protein [bacterium]
MKGWIVVRFIRQRNRSVRENPWWIYFRRIGSWLIISWLIISWPGSVCSGAVIENWSTADAAVDGVVSDGGNVLWTVSTGGAVRWNLNDGSFQKFTTANGLRDNWCMCGVASSDGSFWLGTLGGGLARYRYGVWEHWTRADDGLPYDEIRCLDIDHQNRLWAGFGAAFGNGIGIRQGDEWIFLTTDDGMSRNRVNAIETDMSGAWIGTIDGLDRITGLQVTGSYGVADGLPDGHILSLASDGSGGCWVGTPAGLAHLSVSGITVYHISDGLPHETIQAVHVDMNGTVRVGTPLGAAVKTGTGFEAIDTLQGADVRGIDMMPNGDIIAAVYGRGIEVFRNGLPFRRFALDEPLPGNDVRAVTFHDGKVWFGTVRAGVGWFDGEHWWVDNSECGIETAEVRHVVVDRDGVKWFSTFDQGVYTFDGAVWTQFEAPAALPCNAAVTGYVDPDNVIWIATWGGGIARYDGTAWTVIDESSGLPTNLTYNVARDRCGDYWFTLDTGVVRYRDGEILDYYTEEDGLVFNRVYDVAVDTRNTLWFGACKGLSRFEDDTFTNYYAGAGSLAHYRVREILFDPFDDLWIATGGGVNFFDGETFTTYAPEAGVAGYETYSVTRDDRGNVWFGSEGGLTRIQPESLPSDTSGVSVIMPSEIYRPGDNCRVDVLICNAGAKPLTDHRLYVAIELDGAYYFGPDFQADPDMYPLPDLAPGETLLEIIPDFPWPRDCGSVDDAAVVAAMTAPDGITLVGDVDVWTFGWRSDE